MVFTGKLLTLESLKDMQTMDGSFGLGLTKIPYNRYRVYGHGGIIDGFNSFFASFQDENLSYATVSNGASYDGNRMLLDLLNIIFDKPYKLPEFSDIELTSEDLDKYLGVYSTSTFPLKITISKEGDQLMGQATGQPAFPLEVKGEHKFGFDQAGLAMEFVPTEGIMKFSQGGGSFTFAKEN